MAVRLDAAADRLVRTSGLIDYNAAYTVMGWVYLVSDLNAYGAIFSLNRNGVDQDLDYIGVNADGVSLISYVDIAATPTEVDSGYNFTVATWAHLTIVRASATSLTVWINGVQQGSANTQNVAGRTAATRMEIGAVGTGNIDRVNARVQHVKIWSTNLSAAEILQEYQVVRPVRTADLHLWAPLWGSGDIADYSGNARDWTAGGTLTTEDGPPVSYGAPVLIAPYASAGGTSDAAITAATGAATTSTLAGASSAAATITGASAAATASTITGASSVAAALTTADGAATAGSLAGSASAAATLTTADGLATAATLTAASAAQSAIASASGAATAQSLTGASVAASALTGASGAATTSTLAGASGAAAAITSADGLATASTMTGSTLADGTGAIVPAAGAATASAMTGASTAQATMTEAAGAATTTTMTGGGVVSAALSAAAGAATAATVAGSALVAAAITAAQGLAATALAGASSAAAAITAAAGAATGATLVPVGGVSAVGRVRATFTSRRPAATFASRRPAASFASRRPTATFTVEED